MKKAHPLIGMNVSVGGDRSGYGEYLKMLQQAGLPATMHSQTDFGAIIEACIENTHPDSIYSYRDLESPQGVSLDVPEHAGSADHYTETPREYIGRVFNRLTDEFFNVAGVKDKVWLCILNEVDQLQSEWLAEFGLEVAKILWDEYQIKVLLFNWAAGTPKMDAWEKPKMLRLLKYANENPDSCAIGIHMYSYNIDDLTDGAPYRVGRIELVKKIWRKHGFHNIRVICKEFGFSQDDLAPPESGLQQFDEMYKSGLVSVDTPLAIWYFGLWHGNITQSAVRYTRAQEGYLLQNFILDNEYELPEYDDPIVPDPEPIPIPKPTTQKIFDSHFYSKSPDDKNGGWVQHGNLQVPKWASFTLTDQLGNESFEPAWVFMWDAMFAAHERDWYLGRYGSAYKMTGSGTWRGVVTREVTLSAGEYRISAEFLSDWYNLVDGKKQAPPEANHASFALTCGSQSQDVAFTHLSQNSVSAEFTVEDGTHGVGFAVSSLHSADNNGLFMKRFRCEKLT